VSRLLLEPSIKQSNRIFFFISDFCFLWVFVVCVKFPSSFEISIWRQKFVNLFSFLKGRKKIKNLAFTWSLDFTFPSLSFSFFLRFRCVYMTLVLSACMYFCILVRNERSPGHFLFSASPAHFYRRERGQEQKHPIVLILLFSMSLSLL
jgi:hypothetical protein